MIPEQKSLISFSLYGTDPMYSDGAIHCAESMADFHLRNLSPYGFHDYADNLVIPQHSSQKIMVRTPSKLEKITFQFEVLNAFVAPRQTTKVILEAIIE